MSDFHLVDPKGWEIDLHSVYSAYMGYFQLHSIPWYERSWGHLFESFESFLAFSWPVIIVTDLKTARAHIVTRMTSVGAFLRMIKTRFGETLPQVGNMLYITPFETHQRHLRTISDWASYRKLHSTLPAAVLAAQKIRVRSGEPDAIRELWSRKDKTWLSVDFEWSERNTSSCLEWGYAALRCGHLEALGAWPPNPDTNYRKGHYIVAEYADKVLNKQFPTYPWQYAFGESQVIPKAKLPVIIQSIISSLASPDSETTANNLVLVGHGLSGDLRRFEEMKIKLPNNVLLVDIAAFERALYTTGQRGAMEDPKSGKARAPGSTLSLGSLLHSLFVDVQCALRNSGNDAFMGLFALQKLLDADNTPNPNMRGRAAKPAVPVRKGTSSSTTPSPAASSPSPLLAVSGYLAVQSPSTTSLSIRSGSQGGHYNAAENSSRLGPNLNLSVDSANLRTRSVSAGLPQKTNEHEWMGKSRSVSATANLKSMTLSRLR